jgi:aldose 1-epimerase
LPTTSSQFASFTLAPYSNRIRAAKFLFAGESHQLKVTTPSGNAQHGDVRNRPWRITTPDAAQMFCEFDSSDFGDVNWLWPFKVLKRYALSGNSFTTEISLTNMGNAPMPVGFGFHPYFTRSLGEATLKFAASGYYETDDSLIPDAGRKPVPASLDCSVGRVVGEQHFDHTFAWGRAAKLTWAGQPFELNISASEVFEHLVVYTAPDGTLAIEPVTNCTDGFNLFARGVPGTGVQVLQPGEHLSGEVTMEIERYD